MKIKGTWSVWILAAAVTVLGTPTVSVAGDGCGGWDEAKTPSRDLVETASNAGSFSTLISAVQVAELVDTLKGDGPFTVFAPTDEAFAKIPAGTLDDLLKPENRAQLKAILTYHVVPGRVMAKDVLEVESAITVQGQSISVVSSDGEVRIDGARIIDTDIEAANGVIHVIDTVILPQEG